MREQVELWRESDVGGERQERKHSNVNLTCRPWGTTSFKRRLLTITVLHSNLSIVLGVIVK